jgi:hypothetical protein
MSKVLKRLIYGLFSALAVCAPGGCDSLELPDAVNETVGKAKQAAIESVKSIKQQITATGTIELEIDEAVKTEACYAYYRSLPEGRPSILQIKSYQDEGAEFYPSVFVHAEVSVSSPEQLNGQTFQAMLFVQTEEEGPLWCSSRDSPVELKIISVTGDAFIAEITRGKVVNTQTQAESEVSGKLTGTFAE